MLTDKQTTQGRKPKPQNDSPCCTPAVFTISTARTAGQVRLLAALADPTRLQIVETLAGLDEPLCVCDIQAHFALGQPTISHHLKVLRDAELVHSEKRGLWVYYSLNRETLEKAASYMGGLLLKSTIAVG